MAVVRPIARLNSENKNEYNFFVFAIFVFQKPRNDTVNNADSGDIKIFQEIGSSLVSFLMIFEALQPELFRLMFHALSSKVPKIPEFNLTIDYGPLIMLK